MIYLKRNNKQDANFTAPNDKQWFKPGYIYQLIKVSPWSVLMRVKSPFTGNWLELHADLSSFDYAKGANHG